MNQRVFFTLIIVILLFGGNSLYSETNIFGSWELVDHMSTEIDLYGTLSLNLHKTDSTIVLTRKFGRGRSYADTLVLNLNSTPTLKTLSDRVWPTNVFMGISLEPGDNKTIVPAWSKESGILAFSETYPLRGSQGETSISANHELKLSKTKETLIYTIQRSTRPQKLIQYVLKPQGSRHAWYMEIADDWGIDGMLPEHAFLISLQGLANQGEPRLYFIYPPKWDFRFTPNVLNFLKNERYYTFRKLRSAEHAFNTLKEHVNGYVVWDKNVRTSLIVAFTAAGLEKAVVVSEEMIPMVKKAGLQQVEDFRNKFNGKSDAEIYRWAYKKYWDRCNKEYIVWMGGEHGNIMKPGVADWGIYKKAFFNDLSAKPSDKEEYALANKLLADMQPLSFVFGWHSYKKDKERDHVTLTSSYGLRVEGLHTLPNMSFSSQIPLSPGFEFRNNHNLEPDKVYEPQKKVYISCIQTDCLGLGAWTQPGRGEIPYAWEVTMNWSWLAPAMMEFFYTQATPNDFFIGSLSGPGYMYPKAIPDKYRGKLISIAEELMKTLDLNVFEIMDYSEGATVEGNTELTEKVVNDYYNGMPDAIGFVNGYAPAFTFTSRNGRPLISYDYYLSPSRPAPDAVADLVELAAINSERPYFLLMHVRQWSDITRVKSILDELGPEFKIVPLDIFLKMAGNNPTFKERFLQR